MVNNDTEDKAQKRAWYLYIIEANDGSLYTGIATNVMRRFEEHKNSKRGAKFFNGRKPVKVCYMEEHPDRSSASKREYQVKAMPTKVKRQLVLDAAERTENLLAE